MEVPVCRDGACIGTVRITEQGGWAELEMTCRRDDAGLYRGFLCCACGEEPLGVLAPEEGRLRAFRRIPLARLRQLGEPRWAVYRLSYAFSAADEQWRPVEDDFFCRDFRGALREAEGALWRPGGEGRLLALPWDCAAPFPLIALLCFVRLQPVRGQLRAVLAFDGEERPKMWEKF